MRLSLPDCQRANRLLAKNEVVSGKTSHSNITQSGVNRPRRKKSRFFAAVRGISKIVTLPQIDFDPQRIEVRAWQSLLFAGCLAAPLLLGIALTLRARRRRLYPPLAGPYSFELAYPSLRPPPFDPLWLEDLALLLGTTPNQTVLGELDGERTARATAQRGGVPELVWQARRGTRRHLVLLSNDARLRAPRAHFEALLAALKNCGVDLELYDFSGSVEQIFSRSAEANTFSPGLLNNSTHRSITSSCNG